MKIDFEELELRSDQSYWYKGLPFSGTAQYIREDGSVESEVEFRDGVQEGRIRDLDKEGMVVQEGEIHHGVYHGELIARHSTGEVRSIQRYEYGIQISSREWSVDGQLLREEALSGDRREFLDLLRAAYKEYR